MQRLTTAAVRHVGVCGFARSYTSLIAVRVARGCTATGGGGGDRLPPLGDDPDHDTDVDRTTRHQEEEPAARLDVMPPALWGRAEASGRTAEAAAPLTFGYVAEQVFSEASTRSALHMTLLVMLAPLAAGGAVALRAVRSYGRDVATAPTSSRVRPD